MMIKKLEVRRRLVSFEKKIKEEKQRIIMKMNEMRNECTSLEIQRIIMESAEYVRLETRVHTLDYVLQDLIDMRCEEMFEDTE